MDKSEQQILLKQLQQRFEEHKERHQNIAWSEIEKRLSGQTEKLHSLYEMERTGGEPDVIEYDAASNSYIFYDCSEQSPAGRRNLCYDEKALAARKNHPPKSSVEAIADAMGVELLDEAQYALLQSVVTVDTKTSSWLKTNDAVRGKGGAIFGDYRYGRVFYYHNGADSYYSSRGFRALLRI